MRRRAKGIAWLLTLVYFASYLTRKNFDVMMANICSSMTNAGAFADELTAQNKLAIVVAAMTVAYGIGQIVNGIIGDKIKPQLMLTVGIGLASACNVAMYFTPNNYIPMVVIWCINGFAHSMLWPPIVRLMATYLTSDEYGYAAVRVSWGSSIATIVLYLGCGALIGFMSWRSIILSCALGGAIILVLWIILSKKLFTEPLLLSDTPRGGEAKKEKLPLPAYVFIPIVLIMLGIILQGSLRDGVTTWTPSILNHEYGVPEGNAIMSTVMTAIFSMLSFSLFDLLHRKVFRNEVTCAGVIFAGSAVFSLAIYLTNTFVSDPALGSVLAVSFISLITGCMHGINLMLITVVPKRFIKSGKVSTFSGILNAGTYIGSTVGTLLFPMLIGTSEDIANGNVKWEAAMLVWVVIAALGTAVCFVAVPLWRKFRREYTDT